MKCPYCGHPDDKVIDSRLGEGGEVTRRRRECEKCEHRFTTYERVEWVLPVVVKKDGRREPFDREKLLAGIRIACRKRPVSPDQLDSLVEGIERELAEAAEREVPSTLVGEKVMARLRHLDDVAYVRFASVYREFHTLDEFVAELGKLVKDRPSR